MTEGDRRMDWKTLLACITGSVKEQLLLRNEYVVEENRILRNQIDGRVQLTDAERQTLAAIGKKLGKQALAEVATIVKPATILAWHRKLVAQKFDGSEQRKSVGRPRVDKEIEDLVMHMAKENRSWGYDRIAGALAELGYDISDQSVGNMLKRRGVSLQRLAHPGWATCVWHTPTASPSHPARSLSWYSMSKEALRWSWQPKRTGCLSMPMANAYVATMSSAASGLQAVSASSCGAVATWHF